MSEVIGLDTKKEKETWSFSKDTDGVKKTVSGEEVENGWVITIGKEWREPLDNGDYNYKYETIRYISKDNPVDKLKTDKKDEDANTVVKLLSEIAGATGMLMVD